MEDRTTDSQIETQFLVYGLYDPDTRECRYIGLSTVGLVRANQHYYRCAEDTNRHKAAWILSLRNAGKRYTIEVFQYSDREEELPAIERKWIKYGREKGWPLTNQTPGGEGVASDVGLAQELEAISDAEVITIYSRLLAGESKAEIHKTTSWSLLLITKIKYYSVKAPLLIAQFGPYKPLYKKLQAPVIEIFGKLRDGASVADLALEYGRTKSTIRDISLYRIGRRELEAVFGPYVPQRGEDRKYLEIAPEIHRRLAAGQAQKDIAEIYGIRQALVSVIKQHKIYKKELDALFGPYLPNKEKGWLAPYAAAIFREVLTGRSYQEIADQFGTNKPAITMIARRKTYVKEVAAEFGDQKAPTRQQPAKENVKATRKPRNWYRQHAVAMYREILAGKTDREIAEQFGCGVASISDIRGYRRYADLLEAEFGPKKKKKIIVRGQKQQTIGANGRIRPFRGARLRYVVRGMPTSEAPVVETQKY